ncbi:MAG: 30S ribosome-binding factor RbfA [Neomegalonema sp.]|nr:30S ribosome-binding factor RbfA [Neomegalonema sp.]MDD2869421.1 30S ribosome-binding factor RbfA [Neomegalonema sp.]
MSVRSHKGGADPAAGPSQRQLRVGEIVRRALADVFARGDLHDPDLTRRNITFTEVRPSPDLKNATVFVAPLGGKDEEGALKALRRNSGEIRRALARNVQLKYAPDVKFVIDKTFDRMQEADRLFQNERVRRDVEAGRAAARKDEWDDEDDEDHGEGEGGDQADRDPAPKG